MPLEGGAQLAGSVVDSLKSQPLSLALVVMNVALLVFFYFILSTVSGQREREINQLHQEQKEVRELLAKCAVRAISPPIGEFPERWAYNPGSPCR